MSVLPRGLNQFYRNGRWLYHHYGTSTNCANHVGCSRQHLVSIFTTKRGHRSMPTLIVAYRIAEYYGYNLGELMQPIGDFEKFIKKKRPTPPKKKHPTADVIDRPRKRKGTKRKDK